jgi:Putative DNA-binding domain
MTSPLTGPPTLRQIQEWMAAAILPRPGIGAQPDSGMPLDAWLCVPPPARIDDRLAVYRNGYPARIAESLAETYPAVAHAVGDQAFAALVDRYGAAIPLASYNLNDAGSEFPAFLRDDPCTTALPFLPDLAELEWRVATAFHAFDREPLDPRALPWTVDDWAGAVLVFQPSVSVLASVWPLLDLWTARQGTSGVGDIKRHERSEHVIIRRHGSTVRCELVSVDEASAIRLLLAGRRLSDAVESLAAGGADPSKVAQWFGRWTACGMLAAARRTQS